MTDLTIKKTGDRTADFELPEGCLQCGEALSLRVSPGGAFSVCRTCRWFSRVDVQMKPQGLQVSYPPAGEA